MNNLIGLAICLVLVGCAIAPTSPTSPVAPDPVVATKNTVDIDSSLLQDCPVLSPLPVQSYTQAQAVTLSSQFLQDYSLCWHIHHALVDTAKNAWNINTTPNSK